MRTHLNKIWIFFLSILALTTVSCKKFLSTYSQNNSFVESAADLEELLVGDAYFAPFNSPTSNALYTMDDDVKLGIYGGTRSFMDVGFHFWQSEPRLNSDGQLANSDAFFNSMYSQIARINTILSNVSLLRDKGEPASILNKVSGEAYFLRAYYYFFLANIYGKPYKVATATSDFCIPLKTDAAIKGQFTSRSSNQQVYNQIVADLLEADKYLESANKASTIRANQAAVHALLSRVYLFIENYEQSAYYADQVFANAKYKVTDLNSYTVGRDFLKKNSEEVIFTMGGSRLYDMMGLRMDESTALHYLPSDELVTLYSDKDLRRGAFFLQNSKGQWKGAKKRDPALSLDDASDFYLIRLSEVYLNKAEALAAMNRYEEAKTSLQEFRKYRFEPTQLPPVNEEGAALINFIRDERRRELCMEAHRWFDLRRYAVNSKYPYSKTIRHRSMEFNGTGYQENGYYELGVYANEPGAYILPIANDEIEFNQGSVMNEPRPNRPLKH